MSGISLGFVVEALVAVLLIVTIGYCVIVNRKLESMRSDKSDLRRIIRDLYTATSHAEQAIGTLRETSAPVEESLGEQIALARDLGARLSRDVERAETLLSRLSVVTQGGADPQAQASGQAGGRPAAPPPPEPARPAGETQQQAAPAAGLRHSEMGLGLLNARNREAQPPSDSGSGGRKVA